MIDLINYDFNISIFQYFNFKHIIYKSIYTMDKIVNDTCFNCN